MFPSVGQSAMWIASASLPNRPGYFPKWADRARGSSPAASRARRVVMKSVYHSMNRPWAVVSSLRNGGFVSKLSAVPILMGLKVSANLNRSATGSRSLLLGSRSKYSNVGQSGQTDS